MQPAVVFTSDFTSCSDVAIICYTSPKHVPYLDYILQEVVTVFRCYAVSVQYASIQDEVASRATAMSSSLMV